MKIIYFWLTSVQQWRGEHFLRCCWPTSSFRLHSMQVGDCLIPKRLRCFASMLCPVLSKRLQPRIFSGLPGVKNWLAPVIFICSCICFMSRLFFQEHIDFVCLKCLIKFWQFWALLNREVLLIDWMAVCESGKLTTLVNLSYVGRTVSVLLVWSLFLHIFDRMYPTGI